MKFSRPLFTSTFWLLGCACVAHADPFYMGGDISLLPFIESRGGSFSDAGVVQPMDQIMVDRGANLFRLRLFVNPNPNYSATGGAIQDLNYDIALAQRLKASGAKILLDFHYSDTWADPGKQNKPAAWATQNFATLNTTVRNYTRDSLLAFKNAGVMPEMVQVGNEVTNGMLWPSGQVVYSGTQQQQNQSWMNFGSLLNSAIQGVRDVDAQTPGRHTEIAIHCDGGDVQGRAQYYFGQITGVAGVASSSFDVMGMSFYAAAGSALPNLTTNLNYLATHYNQKVMVLETNNPWKGSANGAPWAITQAGQAQFLTDVRNTVMNLPNGKGQGVVWWYPESIQVPNTTIWKGGAVALFDDDTDGIGPDAHGTLAAIGAFSLPAPTWNIDSDGDWNTASNWLGGVPNGVGQVARFGSIITVKREVDLSGPVTVGTVSFLSNQLYSVGGTPTLTIDAGGAGPGAIVVLGGNHTITTPIALADDLELNVAWTNSLTLTSLGASNKKISKYGSGTAVLNHVRSAALDIVYGKVEISPRTASSDPDGTSVVNALSIATGARLDVTNNDLIVDYTGPTILDDIRQKIRSSQLTTSAGAPSHALGYADNATFGATLFSGQPVDPTSILVKYTIAGDSNLDGQVDVTDLGALATNWQTSGTWTGGDFNYDGFVDVSDLGILATNWQQGVGSALGLSGASVPEPGSLFVVSIIALLSQSRRFTSHVCRASADRVC